MTKLTVAKSPVPWQRNLYVTWFVQLIAIAGFTVVLPILPLYVQKLGIQGDREASIWAGIVFSAQAVTMAVFGPIWGALSDRYGRKIMVERAMFGGAVLMALMGFARTVQQLAILRFLQGTVTGVVTAANALVATTAPRERAGYAQGLLQMALYVGASIGPLLGGVVSDNLGFRTAFWVTSTLLFLAGLGVLLFVKEQFQPTTLPKDVQKVADRSVLHRVWNHLAPALGSAPLLVVLGIYVLTRSGARMMGPVLPLFIASIARGSTRVASITGLISGINAGAGAVGALWLGPLGDRAGHRKILVICSLASVACYIPQFYVPAPLWLLPLQAIAGLAMGGMLASVSASLARLAKQGQEGIVYGVSGSAMAIANIIGPMAGSVLAAYLGLRTPLLVTAGMYALASIAAARLLPEQEVACAVES